MNNSVRNIDLLIKAASAQYIHEEQKKAAALGEDEIMRPQAQERVYTLIRRSFLYETSKFKLTRCLLVAALLATFIFLVSCTTIPRLRLWTPVLDWCDDYISVQFSNKSQGKHTSISNQVKNEAKDTAPDTIESIFAPSYNPFNYTQTERRTKRIFLIEYHDKEGNWKYSFTQEIADSNKIHSNNEGSEITHVNLNGCEAILVKHIDGLYNLYWRDERYIYTLNGYFDQQSELLEVAASVQLRESSSSTS